MDFNQVFSVYFNCNHRMSQVQHMKNVASPFGLATATLIITKAITEVKMTGDRAKPAASTIKEVILFVTTIGISEETKMI